MRNSGTDFRWNLFGMTSKDSEMLGSGLKMCKGLRKFSIRNSLMDDDRFYNVFDGLRSLSQIGKTLVSGFTWTCQVIRNISCLIFAYRFRGAMPAEQRSHGREPP